jgi:hypothetical protein
MLLVDCYIVSFMKNQSSTCVSLLMNMYSIHRWDGRDISPILYTLGSHLYVALSQVVISCKLSMSLKPLFHSSRAKANSVTSSQRVLSNIVIRWKFSQREELSQFFLPGQTITEELMRLTTRMAKTLVEIFEKLYGESRWQLVVLCEQQSEPKSTLVLAYTWLYSLSLMRSI